MRFKSLQNLKQRLFKFDLLIDCPGRVPHFKFLFFVLRDQIQSTDKGNVEELLGVSWIGDSFWEKFMFKNRFSLFFKLCICYS